VRVSGRVGPAVTSDQSRCVVPCVKRILFNPLFLDTRGNAIRLRAVTRDKILDVKISSSVSGSSMSGSRVDVDRQMCRRFFGRKDLSSCFRVTSHRSNRLRIDKDPESWRDDRGSF